MSVSTYDGTMGQIEESLGNVFAAAIKEGNPYKVGRDISNAFSEIRGLVDGFEKPASIVDKGFGELVSQRIDENMENTDLPESIISNISFIRSLYDL